MNDGRGGFYLQKQGRKEEEFLAVRRERTWQVWQAVTGYAVARVPGAYSFHSFNMSAAILLSLFFRSANSVTKQSGLVSSGPG